MAAENYNVPIPEDRQTVYCLYCDKPQDISRKALQVSCKFCNKILKLEDMRFKAYEARRQIDTLGIVTVEQKGNVVADRINCGGLIVRGKVKGEVKSRGPVLIGPEAEVKGNVNAPSLAVGPGAVLDGHYEIGPKREGPQSPG